LKKGPLPIAQALQIGIQIADALDRAHRAGIVHRDLKPGNILLTGSGASTQAKLLDFGLAKLTAPVAAAAAGTMVTQAQTAGHDLTGDGAIVGTTRYMAPEQLEAGPIDGRTDIFALGTVLYEMATGKKAFEGKSRRRRKSCGLRSRRLPSRIRPFSQCLPPLRTDDGSRSSRRRVERHRRCGFAASTRSRHAKFLAPRERRIRSGRPTAVTSATGRRVD
jgi:serine/threonine protein kinase